MWTNTALLVLLNLVPQQADGLDISNIRTTYGVLGAARAGTKILPGDNVFISFNIEGIKTDSAGKAGYSIGIEVKNSGGKTVYKQDGKETEANLSLGGNSVPAAANISVGLDSPAGNYDVKVTVTDTGARKSKSFDKAYEVLPKGFGLVRISTTSDPDGHDPAGVFAEGQSLWINFKAVGFSRARGGQPSVSVTMRVLDEDGKPTLEKPFTGEITKDVPEKALSIPMQFMLELNRAGKFTVELKGADKTGGKDATVSFPIVVQKLK